MASIEDPQTPPNHRVRVAGDDENKPLESQKMTEGEVEEDEGEGEEEEHDIEEDTDQHHDLPHDNRYNKVKLPSKHPLHTPAVNKRRQASKHIVVQSPTDNIFSPISQKLLGRKRNDPARPLPDV